MPAESILIRNFQCHKNLEVAFGPGVTTIVGPNDRGKSTILRALEWVCLGSWDGEFAAWGKDKTWAVLKVDGRKVKRVRGKRGNRVALDGKKFAAVRKDVPPEVAELLRTAEVNFQRQADPYFWFSLTPGQVARELNKVVNLDSIDRTLANLAADVRAAKAEEHVTLTRLEAAKAELHNLKRVPEFLARFRRAEAKKQEADSKGSGAAVIASKLETVSRAARTRDRAAGKLSAARRALEKLSRVAEIDARLAKLSKGLEAVQEATKAAKTRLPDLTKLTALREKGDKVAARCSLLEGLLDDRAAAEAEVCRLIRRLAEAEKELERKTGGRCPACGNVLSPKSSRSSPRTCTSH